MRPVVAEGRELMARRIVTLKTLAEAVEKMRSEGVPESTPIRVWVYPHLQAGIAVSTEKKGVPFVTVPLLLKEFA